MILTVFAVVAAIVICLGDLLMIPLVMRPLFQSALGEQMLTTLRLGPAVMFYLIHVAGLVYFAGLPLARGSSITEAFISGAVLGFVAYSCYEMTSWTIMRDWNARLVVIDLAWGTVISSLAAGFAAIAVKRWAM
jgi:uncharacterized membrane protein